MFKVAREFALAILCICTWIPAGADNEVLQYRLKGDAPLGSMLPGTAATADMPFDKTWTQLSESQKQYFKAGYYEAMPEGDEPPFPLYGMAALLQPLFKIGSALDLRGTISMAVEVGPDGTARSVSVMRSIDDQSTKAFASVLMVTKYKAAICGGKPCTMQFPVRVHFGS